jgi:hypothetical protein
MVFKVLIETKILYWCLCIQLLTCTNEKNLRIMSKIAAINLHRQKTIAVTFGTLWWEYSAMHE